jgi:hypothetical protein
MVSSQNLGFFSPRYIAWLTPRSPLFWSILSSIFIVARSCFDRRLFFITTPRHDSAAAAAVSETRRRLPTCYSRSAADWIGVTIVDRDRFGSCRPPPPALYSASIGLVLLYTGPARLSLLQLARRFSFGPEPWGHAEPPELPCAGRRVLKKSSGALFSELLSSTIFIRPGAAGTRGAPGAALRREAGAGVQGTRAGPRAAGRWEPKPR